MTAGCNALRSVMTCLPPRLTLLALVATLTGCGLFQPRPATPDTPPAQRVTPFSSAQPGTQLPAGWYVAALPKFRKTTQYELVDDGGTTVVHATASESNSGLAFNLDIDPRLFQVVRWRWKVLQPIDGADNTRRAADDSMARVKFFFSGPIQTLPIGERVFFKQVKAMTGVEMPYATLDYSWGDGAPAGTAIVNTWTTRIRTILVRSGTDGMGGWVSEQRNLYEDYKAAFGEEPGRITHVVIQTDTDATGASAEAWYGDIEFEAPASAHTAASAHQPATAFR